MEFRKRQPIGIELVKRGIAREEDIQKALEYQKDHKGKKIGDILHILGLCDDYKLIEAIGDIVGQKGILLMGKGVDLNITDYISIEVAQKNKALPFAIEGKNIKVCFAENTNARSMENIRMLMLNRELVMESYITFESDILEILKTIETTTVANETVAASTDSVSEMLDEIIRKGIEKRASDIHIEPLEDSVRVRYRIDGELYTETKLQKEKQAQIVGRLKAISNMHQERQEAQDGRITLYDDYNIRVSSQKNIYGEKFVLRMLKKNEDIKSFFELGILVDDETLERSVNKRNAMTIMAAPTGEGKTTTLYSIIEHLNRPEINITTIEDPVEIRIPGLNQIEIDEKTRFADSLRTVLRQDPDVILVGEIRDKETAEIAIQAGQTGHYVLSTIHTIDSVEVITRLRKIGVSDYDIASSLATSISQRLVRRVCPKCRAERDFTNEEIELIHSIEEKYNTKFDLEGKKTYDAIGCKYCNNTGYYGRIGLFEILDINDDLRELIMKGASSIEIKRKALEGSYEPLLIDGLNKILRGVTTLEEVNKKLLLY
ncbi:MAG: type II/IV secretion system protein [Clostridia bacterium]|nr:type II/IV secretion system protein [Clostridia bacterium]